MCACDDAKPSGTGTPTASASAPAPPPPRPTSAPADHVELQKFVLTSGVKSKDPVDDLTAAKPGQRVYGHVTVRNRTLNQHGEPVQIAVVKMLVPRRPAA